MFLPSPLRGGIKGGGCDPGLVPGEPIETLHEGGMLTPTGSAFALLGFSCLPSP